MNLQGNMTIAIATKERPILFSGPMVRAILDGRKTMTRRVVKPQPGPDATNAGVCSSGEWFWLDGEPEDIDSVGCTKDAEFRCPYGLPGDRLWVRETWLPLDSDHYHERGPRDRLVDNRKYPLRNGAAYAAETSGDSDSERCRIELGYKWRPSIHMPRWASRMTLEITDVRVERLCSITEDDAIREGAPATENPDFDLDDPADDLEYSHLAGFIQLWETINGPGSWLANHWVWVLVFKRAASSTISPTPQ